MVKRPEHGLIDDGGQAGANAAGAHALLHNHNPPCLADAIADCLHVKGLQGDKIDHLYTARANKS